MELLAWRASHHQLPAGRYDIPRLRRSLPGLRLVEARERRLLESKGAPGICPRPLLSSFLGCSWFNLLSYALGFVFGALLSVGRVPKLGWSKRLSFLESRLSRARGAHD